MFSRSPNDEPHLLSPNDLQFVPRRSARLRTRTRDSRDSGIDSSRASSANNGGQNVDPIGDEDDYLLFRKSRKLQVDTKGQTFA